jgi:hypothetical protein
MAHASEEAEGTDRFEHDDAVSARLTAAVTRRKLRTSGTTHHVRRDLERPGLRRAGATTATPATTEMMFTAGPSSRAPTQAPPQTA